MRVRCRLFLDPSLVAHWSKMAVLERTLRRTPQGPIVSNDQARPERKLKARDGVLTPSEFRVRVVAVLDELCRDWPTMPTVDLIARMTRIGMLTYHGRPFGPDSVRSFRIASAVQKERRRKVREMECEGLNQQISRVSAGLRRRLQMIERMQSELNAWPNAARRDLLGRQVCLEKTAVRGSQEELRLLEAALQGLDNDCSF